MSVAPTDRPLPHPQVVLREEVDGWTVLFHGATGEAVAVGPVGAAIWSLLDGEQTVEAVADVIRAACEDAPPTVLDDTVAFVEDLRRRSFVRNR